MNKAVTLDDKYTEASGKIYLNGLQAIVRMAMMQHQLDAANNLKTGTFISGYRGSPIGALDIAFQQAKAFTDPHDIKFHPGVNEDLGATSVWGSQQLHLSPGATHDGVVGMWYGKGPGVDRSLDVLKHANAAGSSKHGGVLAFAGDDHACKSSTFPHQSEYAFMHAMIPVLHPAGIEDGLFLGLHGIAMSRFSGCWTGFKIISEFADSSASVFSDPFALAFNTPTDIEMPKDGLNIRWYDPPVEQERRLINFKLPAATAYARANGLDRYTINPARKRIGIVATGKGWMDTMQALSDLGITTKRAEELGIAVYKVALVWPLDTQGIEHLANQVEEILVVEEKRGVIEDQVRKHLYHMPADKRPRVVGKTDETGAVLLPENYELSTSQIADAIVGRLKGLMDVTPFQQRLDMLNGNIAVRSKPAPVARVPYFCSGCPHNTSTKVPTGSRALAGIGCHYMATWIRPDQTGPFTQMGGEGAPWIGQAPFTTEKHIFTNLGDGTYFHSGLLAIRAAVAAKINITYKILYNDAVAMTGGQHVDGELSVPMIVDQVAAEGVKQIRVVTDQPERYDTIKLRAGVDVTHRDDLDRIQREMREVEGTTILIYDQTCAAEKRRRRKRGLMEDPKKRVLINERVCEGCGDCGVQSNCVSIAPVETEFGRKRQIDQSTCNKDYSCVKGFCPSFVTVHGGELRKPTLTAVGDTADAFFADMPAPDYGDLSEPTAVLVTGIGGTGVVTIGAILAMAAHIEGKGVTTMDQTGLAQKGGAVTSHIRIAKKTDDIHTVRIGVAGATVVIGCDMLVTADGDCLSKIRPASAGIGQTQVILNTQKTQTGEFTKNANWDIPTQTIVQGLKNICGDNNLSTLDATAISTALLGNSIATNMFMLGYAYQKGSIPVSQDAIFQAIELNGAAVKMNQSAFTWGRRAAWNLEKTTEIALPTVTDDIALDHRRKSATLEETIARRVDFLTGYQSTAYARQYTDFVDSIRAVDMKMHGKAGALTEAVAKYYYKLMAYKDEYEVARLYTDGPFMAQLKSTFEDGVKMKFNLAPPLLAKRDPETGHLQKREFGAWIFNVFGVMAKFKFLRGTPLDIFGYTAERKMERRMIVEYKKMLEDLLPQLNTENYGTLVDIAQLPEQIRGYGHVKEANVVKAEAEKEKLLAQYKNPRAGHKQAA